LLENLLVVHRQPSVKHEASDDWQEVIASDLLVEQPENSAARARMIHKSLGICQSCRLAR